MASIATASESSVHANGIMINVARSGSGPALLLLHGFPHTWEVWSRVIPDLARTHDVIAPDLRGLGKSSRAADGYDLETLVEDAIQLLDSLGVQQASVVAIDAGAPIAFLLALRHPSRMARLVLMEAKLGDLPRSDGVAPIIPWWFGFHSVPGLAETVVEGHEPAYIGWFLDNGLQQSIMEPSLREAFAAAYTGRESLRCGFEYYRQLPTGARQIAAALADHRLVTPTLAIGSTPIGPGLAAQLTPITDDLRAELVDDCGHIIPLDRPRELVVLLHDFLTPA